MFWLKSIRIIPLLLYYKLFTYTENKTYIEKETYSPFYKWVTYKLLNFIKFHISIIRKIEKNNLN